MVPSLKTAGDLVSRPEPHQHRHSCLCWGKVQCLTLLTQATTRCFASIFFKYSPVGVSGVSAISSGVPVAMM